MKKGWSRPDSGKASRYTAGNNNHKDYLRHDDYQDDNDHYDDYHDDHHDDDEDNDMVERLCVCPLPA